MPQYDPVFFAYKDNQYRKDKIDWHEVVGYECNELYSAKSVFDSNFDHSQNLTTVYSSFFEDGFVKVDFVRNDFDKCPNLWFAYNIRANMEPENIVLLAFNNDVFPTNSYVPAADAQSFGVNPKEQIGSIQWGLGDPKLHQIFVHPQWRRKRVSTALIGADVFNMAGRFSRENVLYGGDVTTDGGEELRKLWSKSPRVIKREGKIEGYNPDGV
jgi:hypothetical protein